MRNFWVILLVLCPVVLSQSGAPAPLIPTTEQAAGIFQIAEKYGKAEAQADKTFRSEGTFLGNGRFEIVHGDYTQGVGIFIKIDTSTGDTWQFHWDVSPDGKSQSGWVPLPEYNWKQ